MEYSNAQELSKALSDLKLMGISNIITHDETINDTRCTTVKFVYKEEK
jgi:hypothetical protein